MVLYSVLGFKSFEDYVTHFFKTLLPTNQTYEYFVDWKKVRENVRKHIAEINLLNALSKVSRDEREELLRDILAKYPRTLSVIPLIIAVRESEIHIIEISSMILKTYNFQPRSLSSKEIEEIAEFCRNIGIIELFDTINDLYAYLLGVEVGLDSNARKNRSGDIYEKIIGHILSRAINDISEKQGLKATIRHNRTLPNIGKEIDYIIYINNKPKIAVECNFYNVTGSKPIETARSYIELNNILKRLNTTFIWITDGPAWRKMKNNLLESMHKINYILNTFMAKELIKNILTYELQDKIPA